MRMTRASMIGVLLAGVLLTGGAALALGAILRAAEIYLTKLPIHPESGLQFHTLPTHFPGWEQMREDGVMTKEASDELGTTNYLSRWYRQTGVPEGQTPIVVELHCAYYTGMIDAVPHVPERCLVGNGWDIAGPSERVRIPIRMSDEDGMPIMVPDPSLDTNEFGTIYTMRSPVTHNRVRMPRGIENIRLNVTPFDDTSGRFRMYAGYFFLANGGVVATADDVRLMAFKLRDDYAYFAKIQFSSINVGSAEELASVVADLLSHLMPEIMRRVPDWIDVETGRYPPDNPRRSRLEAQNTGVPAS